MFIPVSYFSLYGKGERAGNGFEEKNKRYYKILPPNLIKDYDRKTDIYVNYFPALYSKNVLKVLFGRTQRIDNVKWLQVSTDIDLAKTVKARYESHIVTNKFDENGSRIVNQEELDSLKYIINSCKDIGAVPILLTTPYLQEYTDEVKKNSPEFFEEFYGLINEVTEETGIDYYDYAFDVRFINNYVWFMDGDHLNREGARNFTNILMDEVVHDTDA